MNHGSLFSGIGGFDLAAQWMGWDNKFHCELNDFGQRLLKYYWPNAESYDDITKTDFTIWRGRIDVLSGGFPCQPYSVAGKRKGKEDERHLWPEMCRAICEIRPTWVVGENVPGLINWSDGLVFDEIQADLENLGYKVYPFVLPACSVNAPHKRDRVWIVAYSDSSRYELRRFREDRQETGKTESKRNKRERLWDDGRRNGEQGASTITGEQRCNNGSDNRKERHVSRYKRTSEKGQPEREGRKCGIGKIGSASSDTNEQRCQERNNAGKPGEEGKQFDKDFLSFEGWQNFPTQSPVCNGDDGLSSRLDGITFPKWRNESIKAGGNAIVPQVALQIFKAIEAYNNLK